MGLPSALEVDAEAAPRGQPWPGQARSAELPSPSESRECLNRQLRSRRIGLCCNTDDVSQPVLLPSPSGDSGPSSRPTPRRRSAASADQQRAPAISMSTEVAADTTEMSLPVVNLPVWAQDFIHEATWEVAELFGFQVFNQAKGEPQVDQPWVPSTVFVVTDHVSQLVRDSMLRQMWEANDKGVRAPTTLHSFLFSVLALHDNIFNSYECTWCPLAKLHPWPAALMERREALDGYANFACEDDEEAYQHVINACFLLLCDVVLYFLIWTESANVRHMPETMWFLFWCCLHTPAYISLATGDFKQMLPDISLAQRQKQPPAGDRGTPGHEHRHARPRASSDTGETVSLAARRVHCRNVYQHHIETLKGTNRPPYDVPSSYQPPATPVGYYPKQQLPDAYRPPGVDRHDERPATPPHMRRAAANLMFPWSAALTNHEHACCKRLARAGDGGFWCARIITPLFLLLSQEMEAMCDSKEDAKHRLGYDDVNESFIHTGTVHSALARLGVSNTDLERHSANSALAAVALWIGSPTSRALAEGRVDQAQFPASHVERQELVSQSCERASLLPGATSATDVPDDSYCFVPERAAAFWSLHVTRKTFPERRSWWGVYRVFHRVFLVNLVAFHVMMAQCLTGSWQWRALSSGILTHSALTALERFSTWLCTRHTQSTLMRRHAAAKAAKDARRARDTRDAPALIPLEPFQFLRLRRRAFPCEGAPVWGVFGFVEWVLAFFALLALYVLQFTAPERWSASLQASLQTAWLYTSVAYCSILVAHLVATTRPGYCISLSHALRLPAVFRASSCRPQPACWLAGSLAVPVRDWLWQAFIWSCIWAVKLTFEYFLVCRTLAKEVRNLLDFNPCAGGSSRYCLDLSWLLVTVAVAPSVILVLIDGMIGFHLWLTAKKAVSHLTRYQRFKAASQPSWSQCVHEFALAQMGWWTRCMSKLGQSACKRACQRLGDKEVTASAMKHAWAHAWDAVLDDLRVADLLTDAERASCCFNRLPRAGHAWTTWENAKQHVPTVIDPLFLYAGQAREFIDRGSMTAAQGVLLSQMHSLALLLLVELGFLTGGQADKLQALTLQPSRNALVLERRVSILAAVMDAVKVLKGVRQGHRCGDKTKKGYSAAQGAENFTSAVNCLLQAMKRELCGCEAAMATDAIKVLSELAVRAKADQQQKDKSALGVLSPPPTDSSPRPCPTQSPLAKQLVDLLYAMLTVTSEGVAPRSAEARRIISVFLNSLQLSRLKAAPAILEARSLTILTPLYNEEVLYTPASLCDAKASKLNLLEFIKGVYPDDWSNLEERLWRTDEAAQRVRATGASDWQDQARAKLNQLLKSDWSRLDKVQGGKEVRQHKSAEQRKEEEKYKEVQEAAKHPWVREVQLWASMRAQVLARTARGMLSTERALRVLAELEWPETLSRPQGMTREQYESSLAEVAQAKVTYLVTAQTYGNRKTDKERTAAQSINTLLCRHAAMRVAYLDTHQAATGFASSSVLIKGVPWPSGQGPEGQQGDAVEELYRVRLPLNPGWSHLDPNMGKVSSGTTGFKLGMGKPENQNHAIIFAFGEAVQTIDMNQDGCLAEGYKMRNLLAEVSPVTYTSVVTASPHTVEGDVPQATQVWKKHDNPAYDPGQARQPHTGSAGRVKMSQRLEMMRTERSRAPAPTVICGLKEWIISDKAGALATFAASTEFAFATLVQSDMAMGNVRLHYGHPDVFDKLRIMTRGGVSKATRDLHVSEDVLGGLNHLLRGGRITYNEAVSCGKGRDTGFTSILDFESKISAGNGEVMLTRDMARLAPRLDIFRLLHFYHSGLGYFTTGRLMMMGIYLQAFSLAVLGLCGYNLVDSTTQLLIQIGLVSSLPYLAQIVYEKGLLHGAMDFILQVVSGMIPFSIFRMQTTASYFSTDVTYGGATYIATGRGFAYSPVPWVKLYAMYGRTHIFLGFELALLVIVLAATGTAGGEYGQLTWGIWLVAATLIFAPCWFNPLFFNLDEVHRNWKAWMAWMGGAVDPDLEKSWSVWNRQLLLKVRDDDGRQEGQWMARAMGLMLDSLPQFVMAFVAAHRLVQNTSLHVLWSLLYFLVQLVAVTSLYKRKKHGQHSDPDVKSTDDQERQPLVPKATVAAKKAADGTFWKGSGGVVCEALASIIAWCSTIALVVVVPVLFGVSALFLSLYVQLCLSLGAHRAALHLFPGYSLMGRLVTRVFWFMDYAVGTLLLGLVAVLSPGRFFERLQIVMLFDRKIAGKIKDSDTARTFHQLLSRQGDQLAKAQA